MREIAIIIPVILVSLTVHELAHAAAALALGDDTAKRDGPVTLNPLRHVDRFGFLMIVVAGFGWAKPVRFDRTKLRSPERDEVLIAFAGPLSNLLLAVIGVLAIRILIWNRGFAESAFAKYGLLLLIGAILLDRVAGINLLPIGQLTRAILTAMLRAVGV